MTIPPLYSTHGRNVGHGMTSPPLDSTHGRQRRAWHDITTFGQHTRSDYVGCGITSPPLDSTHGRTTSGMAFHHRLWAAHTVKQRWAWHDITDFRQHSRLNEVRHDMPSPPLHCRHGRTTSGVACHHRPWKGHTLGQRRAWHAITSLGQHTQSDDIGRGMTSPPLESTHDRMTSGVT